MHLRSKVVYSPHQKCFWGSTTSDNLAFELAAINLRDFFGNPLNLRWLHICDILIRFHILEASISLVVVRYIVLGAIKHWHLYVNPQWAPGQSYGRYCHKYSQIVTAPQILVILVVVRRKTRQYSSRRDLHFTPEGSDGIGKNISKGYPSLQIIPFFKFVENGGGVKPMLKIQILYWHFDIKLT